MKVTAALAWWDESVEDLVRCVRGMSNIADRVVAFDGSYRRYPHATVASPPEQAEAIRKTADEAGMESLIYVPDRLWAGQVEKRAMLLRAAAEKSDWVVVADADHVITADRGMARAHLASMPAHVDIVGTRFVTVPAPPSATIGPASNWHRASVANLGTIFRALPGLTCKQRHYTYFASKNGGQPVGLIYGNFANDHVLATYEVQHLCLARDARHVLENRAYINDRETIIRLTGQEDDQPGLPEPVWDFETVPL